MLTRVIWPPDLEPVHRGQCVLGRSGHTKHCAEADGPRRKNGTKPLIQVIDRRTSLMPTLLEIE